MPAFHHHPVVWVASVLCCAGVAYLTFSSSPIRKKVLVSPTFLPTYTLGILAWFLHGLKVTSWALVIPCAIQLCLLALLFRQLLNQKNEA